MSGTRWSLRLACTLLVVALAGCQGAEEIRQYQAPREPRIRMLGAIIPQKDPDATWFVKVAGLENELEPHNQAFRDFVASFRFVKEEKGEPPVVWKVPEGWREVEDKSKGKSERFATFHLGDNRLELTVVKLGGKGAAASIEANVNRWRKQLRLPALDEEELGELTQTIKVGPIEATLVDMVGFGTTLASPAPLARPPITYDVPEGWQEAPNKEFGLAAFRAGKGNRVADVTISPLPGAAGGVVFNVQRWREKVGLKRGSEEEARRDIRDITVDGIKSAFVELTGPEIQGHSLAITGVIVPRDDFSWFLKMSGPADVVREQKAAFETFVRSVRFEQRKGE